ncbi:hypothetical protein SAMN04488074_108218 [Lentzea albidocapillata subsp. violacea]|uniref:Uncharacterized protein n=2 Tax=Lentzea albidocapillata TaxID=40571 RepID=A0A1G9GI52_9PSEU|nr:hypothetical protein SAMN04488074_108218 [Lentzea albidocapillata subsp. violacea]
MFFVEPVVTFEPGQRPHWKISTDRYGNRVLRIRQGAPLTAFLYNLIGELAAQRGLVSELPQLLDPQKSNVPMPRRATDAWFRRFQELCAEDS